MGIRGLQVGTSGKFILKSPFDKKLEKVAVESDGLNSLDLIYTIVAKEDIGSAVASGGSVLDNIYIENGLTEADYKKDLLAKVNIITLGVTGYAPIKVPESYIDSWPLENTVPYYQPVLVMPLGPFAKDTDFTYLKQQVEAIVSDVVGIEKKGGCVVHGVAINCAVTIEQHQTVLRRRAANIKNRDTDRARALALEQEVIELKREIVALQELLS